MREVCNCRKNARVSALQVSNVDIGEKNGKLDHAIQIPDTLVIDPVRLAHLDRYRLELAWLFCHQPQASTGFA